MVKRDDNDARLRRRVLAGNLLGYAGLLGGAVVTGVGLAWLYLLKLR